MLILFVIPGRERERANPESIYRSAAEYGFWVRSFGPSRNDEFGGTEDFS